MKTSGFATTTAAASTSAGSQTRPMELKSRPAPRAKKNIIRKKSLSGLRLSAIYGAMGLLAMVTPAIKAPIS